MSELLNRLKKEQLLARKAKDTIRASLLTTVIGESAPSGNQTVTDKDVEEKIGKFYKSLNDNKAIYLERGQDISEVEKEMEILLEFMPKQLSDDEIKSIAEQFISENDIPLEMKSIGPVMGNLSKNYKGSYDGKRAKEIVQGILTK